MKAIHTGRGPWLAMATVAAGAILIGGGCFSAKPARLARYKPATEDRAPWEWKSRAPVAPVVGVGTNPAAPAGTNLVALPPIGIGADVTGGRRLKRGDKVIIYLKDIPKPEEIQDEVDDKGEVNLPLIQAAKVEGKTTSEAEDAIQKAYFAGDFYRAITVIVVAEEGEYFVRGEVKREGRFPITRDRTLLQAIADAGGYTDFARRSQIKIIRGEDVMVVDGDKVEQREAKDPLVNPGDIIIVPRSVFGWR